MFVAADDGSTETTTLAQISHEFINLECPRSWTAIELGNELGEKVCIPNWVPPVTEDGDCPENLTPIHQNLKCCAKREWLSAESSEQVADPTSCPHLWDYSEAYTACIPFWVTSKPNDDECTDGSVFNWSLEEPQTCIIDPFGETETPHLLITASDGTFSEPSADDCPQDTSTWVELVNSCLPNDSEQGSDIYWLT